jgi:hypothetical protein
MLLHRQSQRDPGRVRNAAVVTDDGRTTSGFLVDRDSQMLVLQRQRRPEIAIPQNRLTTPAASTSLMPEGLLGLFRPAGPEPARHLRACSH